MNHLLGIRSESIDEDSLKSAFQSMTILIIIDCLLSTFTEFHTLLAFGSLGLLGALKLLNYWGRKDSTYSGLL